MQVTTGKILLERGSPSPAPARANQPTWDWVGGQGWRQRSHTYTHTHLHASQPEHSPHRSTRVLSYPVLLPHQHHPQHSPAPHFPCWSAALLQMTSFAAAAALKCQNHHQKFRWLCPIMHHTEMLWASTVTDFLASFWNLLCIRILN